MNQLGIAIVGAGRIGTVHAQVYQKHPKCTIVAICDTIEEAAAKLAERFGCEYFSSVDDMLASGLRIDAASVCTAGVENGADHYVPTMKLLATHIPVLGEKPISNNIAEAKEMVALAIAQGVRYGINLNHRYTPATQWAKEWVNQGRLGELNTIRMLLWIHSPNEQTPHFHIRALHPHSVDVMRLFGGDVAKVQAFFKQGSGRKAWSNVVVNLLFANGVIGQLLGSYDGTYSRQGRGSYELESLDVAGSQGRFVLLDTYRQLQFFPRFSLETESYDYIGGMVDFMETFDYRINKWIDQLLNQTSVHEIEASGEDGLKAQMVIEAAIESWETNMIIDL